MTDHRTIYLHIGLHKTGTTYLQETLAANRARVRTQGVQISGAAGEPSPSLAVWDLQGRRAQGGTDTRVAGQWDALTGYLLASERRVGLVSEETLALSSLKQARMAVDSFRGAEVHVVVTVRDLARAAVSSWQQQVKSDRTWTWDQFIAGIRDSEHVAKNPARSFWLAQDVVKVCARWEAVVPADRLHIVTVPKSGAPAGLLLERFCSVVGLDETLLTEQPRWSNESLDAAGIEVIRRLNERLDRRLNTREYHRVIRQGVARRLAERSEADRFVLPADELPWLTDRADAFIAGLSERGYPVVGSLDDLRPDPDARGRRPDDASDGELLDATVDALATLSERYAKAWWVTKRASVEDVQQRGSATSRARGLVFRAQRKAVELADRNPVAEKALGVVMRARDRATRRARGGSDS